MFPSLKYLVKLSNKYLLVIVSYDLLELYFICGKLKIDIKLDEIDIKALNKIIENKKKVLEQFEKSWIWVWANADSDEERDALVKKFNKNRK